MQADELQNLLGKQDQPQIIDVRTKLEYRQGHIPGAQHVPVESVWAHRQILANDGGKVVLCCEHGPRAWLAGTILKLARGVQVDYLLGHMTQWKRAGRPLAKE